MLLSGRRTTFVVLGDFFFLPHGSHSSWMDLEGHEQRTFHWPRGTTSPQRTIGKEDVP